MPERNNPQDESSPTNVFVLTPRHVSDIIVLDIRDEKHPQIKTIKLGDVLNEDVIKEHAKIVGEQLKKNQGLPEIIRATQNALFRKTMVNIGNKLDYRPSNYCMEAFSVEFLSTLKLSEVKELFREAKRVGVLRELVDAIKITISKGLVTGNESKSTIWQNPKGSLPKQ